mmetsp:Transcript_68798/g.165128  ORF Transcript_68798/g.165128 Transcript_68798/m.165128 type:complete len:273 (-) Transcript_68798:88-906(-)
MDEFRVAAFFCIVFWRLLTVALAGDCGGCWCVPEQNQSCPEDRRPRTYSSGDISTFAQQVAVNPFFLDCDPYHNTSCDLQPSMPAGVGSEAVCGIRYTDHSCSHYTLKTYGSAAEAVANGSTVTHVGACGVCSTTQDLASYMQVSDMTAAGKHCALLALVSRKRGEGCFRKLGLTESCAKIWAADALYDARHCGVVCAAHARDPYNAPAPSCQLNACLQCDEDVAGPIFKLFAGRTRRNSGLVSAIVRPCASVERIDHKTCPKTVPGDLVVV